MNKNIRPLVACKARTIITTLLAMMVLPSDAQQVKYTVKGVSNENGKTVYLEDRLTSKAVDSTIVDKGKFAFKGQAYKDAIFGITFDQKDWKS